MILQLNFHAITKKPLIVNIFYDFSIMNWPHLNFCPASATANKPRQRQPDTRAHKTAKGHRYQARMQSIQQLRLPKAANRRTKQKADRQPEAKGLNRSSLPGSRHRATPTSNLDPPPCLRFLPDLRNILDHEEGRFASCYRCRATSPNIATAEGKTVAEMNFRSDAFRKGVMPP